MFHLTTFDLAPQYLISLNLFIGSGGITCRQLVRCSLSIVFILCTSCKDCI